MTWIDDMLAERERRDSHRRLVAESAETIFDDLWAEIKSNVEDAKSKGIPASTNGSPYERVVEIAIPGPAMRPRTFGEQADHSVVTKKLRIKLEKDKAQISISGAPHILRLNVCEDNVVCLKCGGKQISIKDAARTILKPFLFPELSDEAESKS